VGRRTLPPRLRVERIDSMSSLSSLATLGGLRIGLDLYIRSGGMYSDPSVDPGPPHVVTRTSHAEAYL